MARVALVTGGTRGIGAAISTALKEQGRTVIANFAGNETAAAAFHERHGIRVARFDVGDFEACQQAIEQITTEVGPIEVLVNNAGITRDATLQRMTRDMWEAVIDTNLGACFNLCKLTFPRHAGARVRPHRQRRQHQRSGRAVRSGELCRRQVGHPRLHQGLGAGRRPLRHHGECDRAGLCGHRHGARRAATCWRRSSPGFRWDGSAMRWISPAGWRS